MADKGNLSVVRGRKAGTRSVVRSKVAQEPRKKAKKAGVGKASKSVAKGGTKKEG